MAINVIKLVIVLIFFIFSKSFLSYRLASYKISATALKTRLDRRMAAEIIVIKG